MTRGITALVLTLGLFTAPPATAQNYPPRTVFELPHGLVGTIEDNEVEMLTFIPDPTKLRFAVPVNIVESNLGGISWNLSRTDRRHEEYVLLMGRLTASKAGGALYLALRPNSQSDVQEVVYIDNSVAVFRVPVVAPNLSGGSGGSGDSLASGAYRLYQQADGNVVSYEMVEGVLCARWASRYGEIPKHTAVGVCRN